MGEHRRVAVDLVWLHLRSLHYAHLNRVLRSGSVSFPCDAVDYHVCRLDDNCAAKRRPSETGFLKWHCDFIEKCGKIAGYRPALVSKSDLAGGGPGLSCAQAI